MRKEFKKDRFAGVLNCSVDEDRIDVYRGSNKKGKRINPSVVFKAFLDVNGNYKQDNGEVSLENVVIKVGDWSVLTDQNGRATIKHLFADSTYSFEAFSLEDLNGYFSNIPDKYAPIKDSICYVPFVRGVKLNGEVYLDRDKKSATADKKIDLSNIRISAFNGHTIHTLTDFNGNFSMYVPYGDYEISMDEAVIGSRFILLEND